MTRRILFALIVAAAPFAATTAQAEYVASQYNDYPSWAGKAFTNKGG